MFSLQNIIVCEVLVHRIEDATLVGSPKRRDEKRLGAVAGKPVYDNVRWDEFNCVGDALEVFSLREAGEFAGTVVGGKVCPF